jgi:flagellar biosynthesis protein FlhG
MRDFRDQNFYELLGVSSDSSPQELESSYREARRIYSADSVATYTLFHPHDLLFLHRRIEEAFRILGNPEKRRAYDASLNQGSSGQLEFGNLSIKPEPCVDPSSLVDVVSKGALGAQGQGGKNAEKEPATQAPVITEETEITGALMKTAREAKGLTLEKVADVTKISIYFIRNIENEDFNDLPATVYMRGYLRQLATLYGLDSDRVAVGYLNRMP